MSGIPWKLTRGASSRSSLGTALHHDGYGDTGARRNNHFLWLHLIGHPEP